MRKSPIVTPASRPLAPDSSVKLPSLMELRRLSNAAIWGLLLVRSNSPLSLHRGRFGSLSWTGIIEHDPHGIADADAGVIDGIEFDVEAVVNAIPVEMGDQADAFFAPINRVAEGNPRAAHRRNTAGPPHVARRVTQVFRVEAVNDFELQAIPGVLALVGCGLLA